MPVVCQRILTRTTRYPFREAVVDRTYICYAIVSVYLRWPMASITCPKCGVVLEAADDGTNIYDVGKWAKVCVHGDNGTPLLCPNMKAAIEANAVKTDNDTKGTQQ